MSLVERFCSWIAPARCLGCDSPGVSPWCEACGTPEPVPGDPALMPGIPLLVLGRYQGALAQAIQRFKYQQRPDLARPLAIQLLPQVPRERRRSLAWVPVPLHPKRLAERGFNQSALLALYLARFTRAKSEPRALRRNRDTKQQAHLERASRALNVESAFQASRRVPPHVILVDDVVTTGTTARACVQALIEAGSEVSAVIALAHAG